MTRLLVLLPILLLVSCAHQKVYEYDYSLAHLRKALGDMMPAGVRVWTPNQRFCTTNYFPPNDPKTKSKKRIDDAASGATRAFATCEIFGDRRPYAVVFKVTVEGKLKDGSYKVLGQDERLARKLDTELKEYLVKSREKRDLIDDFRPF